MRLSIVVLLAGIVSGCAQKEDGGTAVAHAVGDVPERTLALEHVIELDAPAARIGTIFAATKAACARVPQQGCTVLEAKVSSGEDAFAKVKMRATPQGVQAVIAAVAPQGKLVEQSTTAEDLAKPIQDGARKIAMLTTYRAKLDALARAPGVDADALIKLSREMVEVQSELEAIQGQQAHLNLRVQTELLTVALSEGSSAAFGKPIGAAFADFVSNLSRGIAMTITAVAFLLPAGLAGWGLLAAWRALRRRWVRRQASRV